MDHQTSILARLAPLKRENLSHQIATALRDAILGGKLRAEEALPSERDLAEQFGVNRASVRGALHRLEAWGLVDIRQGGATRVRDVVTSVGFQLLPYLLAPNGQLDPSLVRDLLAVRAQLLGFAASLACADADEASLAELGRVLEALEAADTPEQLQELDYRFFEHLVEMGGNRVLKLIANGVREVYGQNRDFFLALYQTLDLRHHREALSAIREGDPGRAQTAMTAFGNRAMELLGMT